MKSTDHYRPQESEPMTVRNERVLGELRRVVRHAAEHCDEFRQRLDSASMAPHVIGTLDDFSKIPPLRKKDLARLQQEKGLDWFLTAPAGSLRRVYQSPGPLLDPEGRGEDYWGWAEAFHAAGFRSGDLVQMTFSYHLTPAGLMLEEPLHELGCAVIPAGPGNSDVQLELMTTLPVTGFVGMTSFLKILGEKAVKQGLDLGTDITMRTAFVAAERLPESLRTEVEAMFGMVIRQGYGTADVGCIAYECSELGGMHLSSRCHVEICDPVTGEPLPEGETGEVVVTPFTTDYPMIRLATGDLSRIVSDECACGRKTVKLAGILGRADDTAKVKGQFVYPSQVAEVAAMFDSVTRHQVALDNPQGRDRITVKLQLDGDLDVEAFRAAFIGRVKLNPVIDILPEGAELEADAPALVDDREYG
ncbi:phenylacetate--CoA ligase family protein [Salidesulfovibrio brasiliensis]|uniref:phenylacetate--CoA ligase family protein n=1 Tax=Salidesulfovibrio brasiliensis TaxID=221711 RepID=UPI0006D10091|nr:AMP-binding protein [Salidesulfovibrio brasiliensis]